MERKRQPRNKLLPSHESVRVDCRLAKPISVAGFSVLSDRINWRRFCHTLFGRKGGGKFDFSMEFVRNAAL